MGNGEPRVQRVTGLIRDYWAEHPDAADTVRGLAQWWFPDFDPPLPVRVLAEALECLEAEGLAERHTNLDGTVIWRLRKQ